MQLDWRQAQVLGNVAVLDGQNLINRLALDPANKDDNTLGINDTSCQYIDPAVARMTAQTNTNSAADNKTQCCSHQDKLRPAHKLLTRAAYAVPSCMT